jgi:cytochrome c
MIKLLISIGVVLIVTALFVGCEKAEEAETTETTTEEPVETVEIAAEGDAENGLALFMDTTLGTSGMSCESCHPNGGTEGMEMEGMATKSLVGVNDRYPGVFMMMDPEKEVTLAEVVNFCIENPLEGEPLAEDSQEMKDLLAYLESIG